MFGGQLIVLCHVKARNAHGATSGCCKTGNHAHGGGLACTIGTQEADDFAFFYIERNVVKYGFRSIPLGDVLNVNHEYSQIPFCLFDQRRVTCSKGH